MVWILAAACSKSSGSNPEPPPPPPASFAFSALKVDEIYNGFSYTGTGYRPVIKFSFGAKIDPASVAGAIAIRSTAGSVVNYTTSLQNNDSMVVIQPSANLTALTKYTVSLSTALRSQAGGALQSGVDVNVYTKLDSSRKFPTISDDELLTKVQQQTFKCFWDFAHPVSGLARERNTSGDIVTTGGSGFGIMALLTGVSRGFITRAQGLARLQTMVGFLKNTTSKYHGAFPHWINGATGATIPFSTKDNGADLVETSYLIAGLLSARQFFNGADAAETALRNDINSIWNGVEWSWFRKNNENVLYWHWSPTYNWDMNLPIRGWNECLITYILAASSATSAIPKAVYTAGWASNGSNAFVNGNSYQGIQLPLGPAYGGPLFFAHYSFLGIDPNGLTDAYADYRTQVVNHTRINYAYCKANPKGYFGYSDSCWGLTASDIAGGYTASSPTNDVGVIAPTAALSSFPFTPAESMAALKFYYYVLGDKLWKDYGFVDAFALKDPWFADSFLAIDQGPIIVMIENYRSGLLWNLLTSCPEIKTGMKNLGFSAPYL